jgi:acyl-CoA thioesterase I
VLSLYTFGESILDCGHYNDAGITPGGLLVRNDDMRFPEFRGQDLTARGPARLEHRARAGAAVAALPAQAGLALAVRPRLRRQVPQEPRLRSYKQSRAS